MLSSPAFRQVSSRWTDIHPLQRVPTQTADRWEPTSKRCSGCGWLDEDLTLSDRVFHCEQCGLVLERDLNAAIVRHFGVYHILPKWKRG
jgi:Putative transposase DNA-binding domain